MAEPNQKVKPAGREASSELPHIDLAEKGRDGHGKAISMDRRLFMRFSVFRGCKDLPAIKHKFDETNPQSVIYRDISDPQCIGIMSYCEDPNYFIDVMHPLFDEQEFASLQLLPEFTMLGRTYSIGYESDLQDVLIDRPVQRVCNPETPWAVWYPLRRSGMFERQPREEQRKMLMEHGGIGHAYGKAGHATDIRLAAHGLNKDDNDFIVGLLGKELFPLSAVVQHMRRTRQTSEFIDRLGPFFVGRAVWQPEPELVK